MTIRATHIIVMATIVTIIKKVRVAILTILVTVVIMDDRGDYKSNTHYSNNNDSGNNKNKSNSSDNNSNSNNNG